MTANDFILAQIFSGEAEGWGQTAPRSGSAGAAA